jgi:hypothetical protein
LLLQMKPATLLVTPLSVRKRYIDFVVNRLFFSRAQTTLSALLSVKEHSLE